MQEICSNCKHIRYPRDKTYEGAAKCMKGCSSTVKAVDINGNYYEHAIVESDFGCNRFEKRITNE